MPRCLDMHPVQRKPHTGTFLQGCPPPGFPGKVLTRGGSPGGSQPSPGGGGRQPPPTHCSQGSGSPRNRRTCTLSTRPAGVLPPGETHPHSAAHLPEPPGHSNKPRQGPGLAEPRAGIACSCLQGATREPMGAVLLGCSQQGSVA